MINTELVKLARRSFNQQFTKIAVQPPPPQDPSQGGMPGGDPSMGGGAPPMPQDPSMGGMPPDPSMMQGGAPPMPQDPSMGGAGAPVGGAGGLTADSIRQIMQETLGQMGMVPGTSGPNGQPGGGKPGKPDLLAMSMDIFQIKKMMSTLFNAMGIPMPQDIIDGPNRNPATGAPMMPNEPGSTSDPNKPPTPMGGAAGGAGGGGSAIKPIGQIQGAFPSGGDGGGKSAAVRLGEQETHVKREPTAGREVRNKAAALATVMKNRKRS